MTELLHESPPTGAPLANLPAVPELTQLMVHLLRGVLYREDDGRLWASLFCEWLSRNAVFWLRGRGFKRWWCLVVMPCMPMPGRPEGGQASACGLLGDGQASRLR